MGDSGLTHEVDTLFGSADDLHTGGILQVVYMGDSLVTWSASIHSIGLGSQVYDSFLGEFSTSHGDTIDDEHNFSSPDRQLVREDDQSELCMHFSKNLYVFL